MTDVLLAYVAGGFTTAWVLSLAHVLRANKTRQEPDA